MRKYSIAIMISGRGSNMVALIEACKRPDYPAFVDKVISDRSDAPGLKLALGMGINAVAIERSNFPDKTRHEAAILDELTVKHHPPSTPHLICLAGFMRILSPDFVQQYERKILNIHPSLLPKYPGLNTHARALTAGDSQHGCSVHFVTEELDEGPVVAQATVDIEDVDDETSLAAKVLAVEHQLYVDAVEKVLSQRP